MERYARLARQPRSFKREICLNPVAEAVSQKWSFQRRKTANTSAGLSPQSGSRRRAAAATSGWRQRRKGLYSSSSPSVEGRVGWFFARRVSASRSLAWSEGLLGSTASAKRQLDTVYS